MASRTFHFYAGANGKTLEFPTQFAVSFTPLDVTQLYISQYPCAWKVLDFAPSGGGNHPSITETWTQLFGFAVDQTNVNNIVSPSDWRSVALGQTTTLTGTGGAYTLTAPTPVPPPPGQHTLFAINSADKLLPMSIGTVTADGKHYSPVLQWKKVPVGQTIVGNVTPLMQIYAVQGYQAGTLIQAALQNSGLFKDDAATPQPIDVLNLANDSYWNFYSVPGTGELKVEKLDGPP